MLNSRFIDLQQNLAITIDGLTTLENAPKTPLRRQARLKCLVTPDDDVDNTLLSRFMEY